MNEKEIIIDKLIDQLTNDREFNHYYDDFERKIMSIKNSLIKLDDNDFDDIVDLIKMMSDKVYSASKNSYDSGFEAAKDKYDNNGDDTIAYENGYEDGYNQCESDYNFL